MVAEGLVTGLYMYLLSRRGAEHLLDAVFPLQLQADPNARNQVDIVRGGKHSVSGSSGAYRCTQLALRISVDASSRGPDMQTQCLRCLVR